MYVQVHIVHVYTLIIVVFMYMLCRANGRQLSQPSLIYTCTLYVYTVMYWDWVQLCLQPWFYTCTCTCMWFSLASWAASVAYLVRVLPRMWGERRNEEEKMLTKEGATIMNTILSMAYKNSYQPQQLRHYIIGLVSSRLWYTGVTCIGQCRNDFCYHH